MRVDLLVCIGMIYAVPERFPKEKKKDIGHLFLILACITPYGEKRVINRVHPKS